MGYLKLLEDIVDRSRHVKGELCDSRGCIEMAVATGEPEGRAAEKGFSQLKFE